MSVIKCPACGSSQPAGTSVCKSCGTSLPVAKTLDDLAPIGFAPTDPAPDGADRGGTVPEAPVSAALQPGHLAAAVRPAQSAQTRATSANLPAGTVIDGKYAIVR